LIGRNKKIFGTVFRLGNYLSVLLLLASGIILQISGTALASGSASLTLQPASGSVTKGSNLSVTIHENSGSEQINAVEADLTYDQSSLQFVSIDTSTSAFDLGGPASGGSGSVKIARAKSATSLTDDQVVAIVNFTTLVGSGSTDISFANSCQIIRTSDYSDVWDGNTTGGTYSLTGDSTGGGGTSGGTSGGGGSSAPSSPSSAPTSNPTSTNQNNTSTPRPTSSNTTTPTEQPAQTAVTSTTPAPIGYYVAIRVLDANKKPVQNAAVSIDGIKAINYENKTGLASFSGITAGNHTVTVNVNGKKYTKPITVASSSTVDYQQFNVQIPQNHKLPWVLVGGVLAIIIILVVAGAIIMKGKLKGSNGHNLESYTQFPVDSNPSLLASPIKSPDMSPTAPPPTADGEVPAQIIQPNAESHNMDGKTKL
jgi:hypothetical protein